MTSTGRPGASWPTGVLLVLGAGRTFGALPPRATPMKLADGVPVPTGPGEAAAVTVASATAVAVPPFASVATDWVLVFELVSASIGLPSPGLGSACRITRKAITVATIPTMIHSPRPQWVVA